MTALVDDEPVYCVTSAYRICILHEGGHLDVIIVVRHCGLPYRTAKYLLLLLNSILIEHLFVLFSSMSLLP